MSHTIRVLYGTETGNAEDCANDLGDLLQEAGYVCEVNDMDDFDPPQMLGEKVVLIVTSTFGNGDAPVNAETLKEWLESGGHDLAGLSFGVCGLGDTTYPRFAQCGKDFDRLLEENGARRVIDRHDCDVDYEDLFETFCQTAKDWLSVHGAAYRSSEGGTVDASAQGAPAASQVPERAGQEPKPGLLGSLSTKVKGWFGQESTATSAQPLRVGTRDNPVEAVVTERVRLNGEGSDKETMHYALRFAPQDVAFLPGDSFAVFAPNPQSEVRRVLELGGWSGEERVSASEGDRVLSDWLTDHLDLQQVTPALLELLTEGTRGPGANMLEQGKEVTRSYLTDRHLVDLLQEHEGFRIEPATLVKSLKKLKPRLYSVANSPLCTPGEVHFLVETLRYTQHGRDRLGVASTWLCDHREVGQAVRMYRVPGAHFYLPEDGTTPVIMIGPGTGLAPFRGFLQHRDARGDTGSSWLFFGHQHAACDYLYEQELKAWEASGRLTQVSLAWSRDQEEKVYVQHRMLENAEALWSWMQDGAHVYVCGDRHRMAPEVRAAFVQIAVNQGQQTPEEAEAYVAELESRGRYHVDAY